LLAVQDAGKIYRHIAQAKGEGKFITEVSMDETDEPQTPPELLVILAALADEKNPSAKRSRRNLPADSTKGRLRWRSGAIRKEFQRRFGSHRICD